MSVRTLNYAQQDGARWDIGHFRSRDPGPRFVRKSFFLVFMALIWVCPPAHGGRPIDGRVSEIELTEEEESWLKEHPNVRLCFTTAFPPLLIVDNGVQSGFGIDIVELLEQHIGINIDIETHDWTTGCEAEVNSRRLDGILLSSPERQQLTPCLMTKLYFFAQPTVYARWNTPLDVGGVADLAGLRVTRAKGIVTIEHWLRPVSGQIEVAETKNALQGMNQIMRGEADVFVGTSFDNYIVVKYSLNGIESIYVETGRDFGFGTAIRNDWPQLVGILNKALTAIGHGKIQKIAAKWIVLPASKEATARRPPLNLTPEERAWLKDHPVVKMVGDPNWLPFEAFDKKGKYVGIVADFIQLIEKQLDIEFEVTPTRTWSESVERIKAGTADIISETEDSDLQEQLFFTSSYLSNTVVIVMKNHHPYVESITSIRDKKIAIIKDYGYVSDIVENYPNLDYVVVSNIQEGLMAVSTGEADALLCTMALGGYTIPQMGLHNIRIVGKTEFQTGLAFGIRRDFEPLVSIVNKALNRVRQSERRAILERWAPSKYVEKPDYGLMLRIGGVLLLFLLGTFYWNRRLAREVKNRKHAEGEAEAERKTAESANRAKSEFLANMSHEIRTPMNAILGFTDILLKRENEPESSRYLKIVQTSGNSLLRLIDDILDLSKIEAGKLNLQYSAVSVKVLAEELKVVFEQKIADRGLEFIFDIDDNFPQALILDEIRLRQVLLNLLSNGVKFTQAGHIRLGVTCSPAKPESVSSVDLTIEVEDTGRGISTEMQQLIFEPFEQARGQKSAEFGGTGLGLTITKRLLTMMGGQISVESSPGKGSVFRVRVPDVEVAAVKAPKSVNELESSREIVRFGPAKILIADDIDYNREMLAAYLGEWPITIYEASNGQEAIEMARIHNPDLILLDLKMPVMDGYEALETLKKDAELQAIPVIAVTASALKQEESRARELCDGYLHKPVNLEELTKQLMAFLPHEREGAPPESEAPLESEASQNEAGREISPSDVESIPPEWVRAFSKAVGEGDSEVCLSLIGDLPQNARGFSHTLEGMVGDYQFGKLAEMLKNVRNVHGR